MPTLQPLARRRTIEALLFAVAFVAYAWFHMGGGWNQNARFAMVRAVVEEGTFSVDSFLVYARDPAAGAAELVRVPVRNAGFTLGGRSYALAWPGANGALAPIAGTGAVEGDPGRETVLVDPEQVACSGDLAFRSGRFHPAKAPGGALAAVPAYLLVRAVERAAGLGADGWWTLTVNAWLTSALSVGLAAALGCVLFFRLAFALSGGRAREALLATLAFAFGTMYFPYATGLYEHDLVAVALLASFYLLVRAKAAPGEPRGGRARTYLVLAGASAAFAATANYVAALAVVLLGGYLAVAVPLRRAWIWFSLGAAVPLLALCGYHLACFGAPFATSYAYESPAFRSSGGFLGVFAAPDWTVLPMVLVSPFRGLLVGSPALLLGAYGWVRWWRGRVHRAEVALMISLVALFLLFVTTFNGWHGGWAAGPRYLVPALPFLALPSVAAFERLPRTSSLLAAASVAIQLLVTAVDPQSPLGIGAQATIPGRPRWAHSPIADWEAPLFLEGRAGPLLEAQREEAARFHDRVLRDEGVPAPERAERVARLDAETEAAIRAARPAPLLVVRDADGRTGLALSELSTLAGPVSVNPVGVYEAWMYRLFPPGSPQAAWNAFNAGELLFPRSRWSLAPLLALCGTGVVLLLRLARREPEVGAS